MAKYVIKREINHWMDDVPLIPQVQVDSNEPVFTALITHTGEPVMRLPNPIGFGRDDEW